MATVRHSGRQPLADRMYDQLLARFADGGWSADEPVNIVALARELNVSQTPLREALARLEHTGLVRREAMKGYRVAPLFSETELAKLMEARLVLEPAMAYEAARRTTPEFLEAVLDTVEGLSRTSEQHHTKRFGSYWAADEGFHALIAKQCNNPFLEDAYRSLGGQVQRFRLFSELGSSDAEFAAAEHRSIYDALAAGDADEASARMREHVGNAKARALRDRQAVPGP